jgi:hypothetical protein
MTTANSKSRLKSAFALLAFPIANQPNTNAGICTVERTGFLAGC